MSNKGGARKGAGRPKGEPTTTIAFRVKVKHVDKLKQEIKQLIKNTEL
jgi:hypothetical protein